MPYWRVYEAQRAAKRAALPAEMMRESGLAELLASAVDGRALEGCDEVCTAPMADAVVVDGGGVTSGSPSRSCGLHVAHLPPSFRALRQPPGPADTLSAVNLDSSTASVL